MADDQTVGWHPGQRAVIGRRLVVTVDRVTPTGRAVVKHGGNERVFEANGVERKSGSKITRLDPLTPEIEAEIALSAWSVAAFRRLGDVLEAAERWSRSARPGWGKDISELDDVVRAERLAAAIEEIVKEPADA